MAISIKKEKVTLDEAKAKTAFTKERGGMWNEWIRG